MSISADEYLCYGESSTGQFTPLIGAAKYDSTLAFREVVKEDLARIYDEETVPGSWIFRKTVSSSGTWVKRFAIIRGSFIFLFHSPQNEKPLAIIPLEGCRVVLPEGNEKSFDEQRYYTANDGYEFDIRHPSRTTARFYALSPLERDEWVQAVTARVALPSNINDMRQLQQILKNMPTGSNITVSNTKLVGLRYGLEEDDDHSEINFAAHTTTPKNKGQNPFAPPRIPEYEDTESVAGGGGGGDSSSHYSAGLSPVHSFLVTGAAATGAAKSGGNGRQQQAPPLPTVAYDQNITTPDKDNNSSIASLTPNSHHHPFPLPGSGSSNRGGVLGVAGPGSVTSQKSQSQLSQTSKFKKLEVDLGRIVSEQQAARDREDAFKLKMSMDTYTRHATDGITIPEMMESVLLDGARDTQTVSAATGQTQTQSQSQSQQVDVKLSFAELFRLQLFFYDEELAEDPQPGSAQDFPHAKGSAIDAILVAVYQRYCNDTGYMTLEQLVDFLDEAAILQTHTPHNDNDEPLEDYKDALDAVTLLRSLPRNYSTLSIVKDSTAAAVVPSRFGNVDFGQWYQLLVRISQIVYPDLFTADRTVAFAKILSEIIVPMFPWCKHRLSKRYTNDPILREERILLVLITYAPNLWKVFLTYCADAVGKVPEVNSPFPECAQLNERAMYKLSAGSVTCIPQKLHPSVASVQSDSWIMSENACQRFARDYGLTPHLLSSKQLKDMIRSLNRQKMIISSRLPVRDQLNMTSLNKGKNGGGVIKSAQVIRGQPGEVVPLPPPPPPMYFGAKKDPRQVAAAKQQSAPSSPNKPGGSVAGAGGGGAFAFEEEKGSAANSAAAAQQQPLPPGISFSEFVELIARVAVDGMESQPNYHIAFPTPFSKVLALLTVWGVADLSRLEEVRTIRTDEAYH